ncbi:MAG: type II secretion system protein GspD [Verrucomicrobia bacterium]|nr:type II secretion system protein GspD [Verrucomicrobiota bacterium]
MGKTLRWLAVLAFVLSLSCILIPAYGQDLGETDEFTVVGDDGMVGEEDLTADEVAADFETEKALQAQVEAENAKLEAEAAIQQQPSDYDLAVSKLKRALELVPDDEEALSKLKTTQKAYVYELLRTKRYTEAIRQADDFLGRFNDQEDLDVKNVMSFRDTAVELQGTEPEEEEDGDDLEKIVIETPDMVELGDAELLTKAIDAFRKKDYDLAKDMLLNAREVNPYNVEVLRWLERVNYQMYLYNRAAREPIRREMLTQVDEVWQVRPRRAHLQAIDIIVPDEDKPSEARALILKKLETIIPKVDFKDAELREVINYLAAEAKVNIVIDPVVLGTSTGMGPAAPPASGFPVEIGPEWPAEDTGPVFPGEDTTTPTGEFAPQGSMQPLTPATDPRRGGSAGGGFPSGPSGGFPGPSGGFPGTGTGFGDVPSMTTTYAAPQMSTITIKLENVPLKFVLRYVLRYKSLKYVVEDYAILIIPIDYALPEDFETEIFRLSTSGFGASTITSAPTGFGADATGTGGGTFGGGGGGGGYGPGFSDSGAGAGTGQAESIEEFLRRAGGVSWPPGSDIVFHQPTATLIVRNTPTNMVMIRELIKIWDQPPMQVEIEARFADVLMDRNFENSFRIAMTDALRWTRHSQSNFGTLPLTSRQRIEMLALGGNLQQPGEGMLRVNPDTSGASALLSISGILTQPEFAFIWNALEQTKYTELLNAPRVTTISGNQALIQVVDEIRYPTEYETETIGDVWQVPADFQAFFVTPSSFETREVGIRLNVTPTVSANGEVITLVLLPEVSELLEWIDYGTPINPARQPVFKTRNVTTTVYINDGETLVLGGIIESNTALVQDRVPFLGSIPVVGRLFRSTYELEKKSNLMIFVTAELITSRGTRLRQEREITEQHKRYLDQFRKEREEAEAEEISVPDELM